MRRVLIIGSGGAGKSTLALRVAERTGLPLIHLDKHYWHAGWIPTGNTAWDAKVAELVAGDAWIIDGNYGRTMARRLAACDTVVFLDLPRLLCVWRLLWRRLRYGGRNRPDMAEGCPEQVSWDFLLWAWEYPRNRRPGILRQLEALDSGQQVFRLRSRRAVARFVAGLPGR